MGLQRGISRRPGRKRKRPGRGQVDVVLQGGQGAVHRGVTMNERVRVQKKRVTSSALGVTGRKCMNE